MKRCRLSLHSRLCRTRIQPVIITMNTAKVTLAEIMAAEAIAVVITDEV